MRRAVIVDAVRSPMGRGKSSGQLAGVHPVDLLAGALTQLLDRNGVDPGSVDDVLTGCVGQAGEQSGTPGRQAVLAAEFPTHVPATTIERKCGSGQQAVDFAAHGVVAGAYDIAIAAGVESMSRVPMGAARGTSDPHGPAVRERFGELVPQGISAELVAARWKLSRGELDEYSARSHERAARARAAGEFDAEIVPVTDPADPDSLAASRDQTIREGSTPAALGQLSPAFDVDAYRARFPELPGVISPGNSSQITDGASALLVLSAERADELLRAVQREYPAETESQHEQTQVGAGRPRGRAVGYLRVDVLVLLAQERPRVGVGVSVVVVVVVTGRPTGFRDGGGLRSRGCAARYGPGARPGRAGTVVAEVRVLGAIVWRPHARRG